MGINRILLSFLIAFTFFISSCKPKNKSEATLIETTTTQVQGKNKVANKELIDFVKKFYTSYLNDFNNKSNTYDLEKYLSNDFIRYLGQLDYNGIIHAQDYETFDLNTLKVSETPSNEICKVEFMNMGYETVVYVKVKLIDEVYKITNIASKPNQAVDIILSDLRSNDFDFDFLKYNTDPDDPHFAIIYTIENFDANAVILKKVGNDESYEYFCLKKKTKKGLELYYKNDSKYDKYLGNTDEPLIILYKKDKNFYAKSSLIKDGKEVKFKERGW